MKDEHRSAVYDEELHLEAYRFEGIVQPFPVHFHEHYVLGLVERGERRLSCCGKEFTLRAGDLLLLNLGDSHACKQCGGETLDYRSLTITQNVMRSLSEEITGTDTLPRFSPNVLRDSEAACDFRTLHELVSSRSREFEKEEALPPLYQAAANLSVLFILYFGAKNVLGTGWRAWDIAAFTTFLSCFMKMSVKSSKAAKLFNSVQRAEVSWKRIKPLMKQPEQLEALQIPAAQDVTLENLSFSYGEGSIFSGLSLTAHPGDIIGVTGPVACGKSTFGRVFLCEAPYGGSAKFGKTEFAALTPRQISATVGYLGHDPELSADTVQNNVLCGSEQDAMPWLAAAALDGEVLAMENGVDTVIGPSGTRLSGGQAQRLALARTLAHPRPVLILDDPFSALDRHTEDTVFADLQNDAKDKVVFLISHRLYHFPQMQKVIFMDGGKTTVGTHAQLIETVPLYRQLYESQTVQKEGDLDEE